MNGNCVFFGHDDVNRRTEKCLLAVSYNIRTQNWRLLAIGPKSIASISYYPIARL
jgi:hypothetical protein